jgi:hypothetical protein
MNDRRPDRPDPEHRLDRDEATQAAEVVTLRGPGHLVTAVAYLLGYQPTEPSLVVVGVLGGRLVLTARIDLPDLTELPDENGLTGAWAMFDPPLHTSGADTVAVLAYTDPAWRPVLRRFAEAAPLPVLDLLLVHDGRWQTLNCPQPDSCDHPGCGPDGVPVTDHPEIAAPLIAVGTAAPGTRADLAAGLRPGPAAIIDQVTQRLRIQPLRSRQALYQAVCEARDARTGGPDPIPPGQAAVLLTALTDPHIRDACLAWTDAAAWWLWHDLIAVTPPGHVAPVATLIAVTAYQRGDGVMASIATEHALTDRPGYGLARLVKASLNHAIPPEAISTLIAEALASQPLAALTGTHPAPATTPADTADTADTAETETSTDRCAPEDQTPPEHTSE